MILRLANNSAGPVIGIDVTQCRCPIRASSLAGSVHFCVVNVNAVPATIVSRAQVTVSPDSLSPQENGCTPRMRSRGLWARVAEPMAALNPCGNN